MSTDRTCCNCGATDPSDWLDDAYASDASTVPYDDHGACTECYVNESCPDGCSEPHAEPDPNSRGQWTCPTTGTLYRYDTYGGDWSYDRWNEGSTEIGGDWYTDPWEHYCQCEACGEWVGQIGRAHV